MHSPNSWKRLVASAALVSAAWFGSTRTDATEGTLPAAPELQQTTVRPADLVLRNGKIVTVDESRPVAEALAVSGDTIVAVGSNTIVGGTVQYAGAAGASSSAEKR